MNGRIKRRITQLLAATTVLGGTGVGVYQFTIGNLTLPTDKTNGQMTASPLRAEEATPPTTLDAVADAFASGKSDKGGDRSAATEVPLPDVAVPKSAPDEELTELETEPEIATVAEASPTTALETDRAKERSDIEPVATVGDRYSVSTVALPRAQEPVDTTSIDPETGAVARGQQPDDEPPTDDENGTEDEPTTEDGFDSSRARAAFSDRPPSAPQSQLGDTRYGAMTEPSPASNGSLPPDDGQNVDPFAAQQQPAPLPSSEGHARPLEDASNQPVNELRSQPRVSSDDSRDEDPPPAESPLPAARNAFANNPPNTLRSQLRTPADEPADEVALPDNSDAQIADDVSSDEGTGQPGERALEGPQQPSLVVQKFAPEEIQVGKPAKFHVVVHNVGDRPADDVVVLDEIPQGTRLVSTTPRAEGSGGELTWQLGRLSVGEQRSVEMLVMPIAEGEIGSVATVTCSTQASVKTTCTLPQLALRLTAPRQVMIGSEQRVKIELHNPGTGDATGVMLFETVPNELKHTAGPALEFEVGTLGAGETREMELVLSAEKPGKVVNRISARGDGNLQVEQEIEFDVIAPALELGVDGPRVRYLERAATYKVSVGNPGTAPAREIELVTKLPKGLQFVSANNLGEYDSESHAVYWSLAELPEGEAGQVELVAMPIESGEHEIKVSGRAMQGVEDETSQPVMVEGLAAIMFEVRDLEDPIEVGGETNYEIRVENQGTKPATGVQVRADLEPGMKVVSASGETRHAVQAGSVVFEPLTSLAPKSDTVYRITVQGVEPGDQRIGVEVSTDDINDPIRKEESTRVFGDQ